MDSKNFSALEIDAIGEILNISLGASATAVSTMLDARVDITTPVVRVLAKEEFEFTNLEPAVGVEITYISGLSGSNIMLLKRHDVKVIVDMLMGMETPEEEFELNELNISAICEVMNQMMGASSTALSEFLNETVNISTPHSFEIANESEFKEKYFTEEDKMVVINFTLKIGEMLQSEFINVMPTKLAKDLVAGFLPQDMLDSEGGDSDEMPQPVISGGSKEPEPSTPSSGGGGGGVLSQEEIERLLAGSTEPEPPKAEEPVSSGGSSGGKLSQEEIEALLAGNTVQAEAPAMPQAPVAPQPSVMPQTPVMPQATMMPQMQPSAETSAAIAMQQQTIVQMQQMMLQMQQEMQQMMQNSKKKEPSEPKTINVHPVPGSRLEADGASAEEQEENRELIMGVPLEVSVEIGRTKKLVKEILEFTKGSLVILDKLAGEQVDLFVNGQCIAKGDVVVVDDNFGIRITEIVRKVQEE